MPGAGDKQPRDVLAIVPCLSSSQEAFGWMLLKQSAGLEGDNII